MSWRKTMRSNKETERGLPVVTCRCTPLSTFALRLENARFGDSGGASENNRESGFVPAYRNIRTGQTVASCFANGEPAPVHVLEGLPEDWVLARDGDGQVSRVLATVVSGFIRDGRFYTREAAATLVASEENA